MNVESVDTHPGQMSNRSSYRITIDDRKELAVPALELTGLDDLALTPNPSRLYRQKG